MTNFIRTLSVLWDYFAPEKIDQEAKTMGFFILISSKNVALQEILLLYYTRQAFEQIFDISKNNVELLPLRTHSEETFCGHFMTTFLASILFLLINKHLNGLKMKAIGALITMRNLKCKIYIRKILVKEITKNMKSIMEKLQIVTPTEINIGK